MQILDKILVFRLKNLKFNLLKIHIQFLKINGTNSSNEAVSRNEKAES